MLMLYNKTRTYTFTMNQNNNNDFKKFRINVIDNTM